MEARQTQHLYLWRLMRGHDLLGVLEFDALEMFWTDCRFRPTPALEAIRPLFDAELAAGGDLNTYDEIEEWERAWAAIEALGLVLDPQDGRAPIPSDQFILHIWPDDTARLRV
jgi:hypothetical protein